MTQRDLVWSWRLEFESWLITRELCDLGQVTFQSLPFLISPLGISGYASQQYPPHTLGMQVVLVVTASCVTCFLQRCSFGSWMQVSSHSGLLSSSKVGTREWWLLDQTPGSLTSSPPPSPLVQKQKGIEGALWDSGIRA